MTSNSAKQIIIHHCLDIQGFLATLKVDKKFNENAFHSLLAAIKDYRVEISSSNVIDRKVAGCLHFLVYTLLLELDTFPEDSEADKLIRNAHAECWELVQDIFALQ